ncbi:fic doc family protein [Colletotrichum incanum]|uniref:Fic doc family protein n=1 Tax=Colletotrichum incanum TaxID=1573173 RepID=A0A166P312_COLIC|nr:fic doc family protein [Colletotrichum incanum]
MSGKVVLRKQHQARWVLLIKIYDLASRRCGKGYVGLGQGHKPWMDDIDALKAKLPTAELGKTKISEHGPHAQVIIKWLFQTRDLASTSSSEPVRIFGSETEGKTPDGSAVSKLKNHNIASQWIPENAAAKVCTAGFHDNEVRVLDVAFVRNTNSEVAYDHMERERPDQVFQGRQAETLHPLVLACQMTADFVYVHPFPDGNGRTNRMTKQDCLPLEGYLPVVIRVLQQKDYLRMIDNASEVKW